MTRFRSRCARWSSARCCWASARTACARWPRRSRSSTTCLAPRRPGRRPSHRRRCLSPNRRRRTTSRSSATGCRTRWTAQQDPLVQIVRGRPVQRASAACRRRPKTRRSRPCSDSANCASGSNDPERWKRLPGRPQRRPGRPRSVLQADSDRRDARARLRTARRRSPRCLAFCATSCSTVCGSAASDGVATFHDLLAWARDLLRDNRAGPPRGAGALPAHLRRRVPGHRPAAGRDRLLPGRRRTRWLAAAGGLARHAPRAGQAVPGRRSQAEHLPLPRRRHRDLRRPAASDCSDAASA